MSSKVSTDYQSRTNIAKEGYFKLDPFRYQFDKKHFIDDSNDYKLRFVREMLQLEMMNFKALMSQFPTGRAAALVRGHCDSYCDYSLQKQ